MAMHHRLARLERRACGARPCAECGRPPAPVFGAMLIHVPLPPVLGEPSPPPEPAPQSCPRCGRADQFVVMVPPPRVVEVSRWGADGRKTGIPC